MAPVPISAGSRGGDSLHLPAGALLCPPQHGVFSVCFQVLLTSPECFWGSQPVPGAALRCACLPSGGVSGPGIAGMGPQGRIRAATGSWWRVLWSWTLSGTMCSYPGDPFQGAEEQDFSNPSWGLSQQLCAGKATKSRRLWLLPLHKLQKVQNFYVLPPNRDEIIYQIKPKIIIFFKEIVKSHILSAYSAE